MHTFSNNPCWDCGDIDGCHLTITEVKIMKNALTGQLIDDASLKTISSLAEELVRLEKRTIELEKQFETHEQERRNISENLLPEAMAAVGMESFSLKDGSEISINKFYSAKIPDDNKDLAFHWLRENGFESLIKRIVSTSFGKGEDELATQLVNMMRAAGFVPDDKSSVHSQTLKAFVREQMEAGNPVPTDLFGVYVGNRTKITPA